jgi:hypothetical protein
VDVYRDLRRHPELSFQEKRTATGAGGQEDVLAVIAGLPSDHSPRYTPVIEPTLATGISALVAAASEWLG